MTPEQKSRLESPEVTAARVLLAQIHDETFLDAIHAGERWLEPTPAALLVERCVAEHVLWGHPILGLRPPTLPVYREPWERLRAAVEAAARPRTMLEADAAPVCLAGGVETEGGAE